MEEAEEDEEDLMGVVIDAANGTMRQRRICWGRLLCEQFSVAGKLPSSRIVMSVASVGMRESGRCAANVDVANCCDIERRITLSSTVSKTRSALWSKERRDFK